LLAALALEHLDRAALSGIEDDLDQRGFLAAIAARPDWIELEAGKDFVFELVRHEQGLGVAVL
jgi:hypothetical protein